MFLKRLDITGFKSFATKSVLDFEQGKYITAIVGPNGSGKSNVADAVRWVLGEQSYKAIRSKKSEDVIFAGSGGKNKGSSAKVSIVLDNEDGKAPVDFTDIEISRAIYRDGSGEYFIAGKKSRLLDVSELLAKSGFGQSTYSVIGQGMVDSMLFYGPAERKVLFDEAAGVRQYEIKREQTIRKLEGTHSNVIRAKDILSELNPRLGHLKRQANKAKRKDEIKGVLLEKQKIYYASVWEKLTHAETEKRKELDRITEEEDKVKGELADLNNKFGKILGQEKADNSKVDELREKLSKLEEKKDTLKQEIYTERARLQLKVSDGLSQEEIENKIKSLNSEINELKISEKEQEKEETQKELEKTEKKISEFTKKIEAKRKEAQDVSSELDKFDLGSLDDELSNILDTHNLFLIKLEASEKIEDVKSATKMGRDVSKSLEKLMKKVGGTSKSDLSEISNLQESIQKLTQEKEVISEERDVIKGRLLENEHLLNAQIRRRTEIKEQIEKYKKAKPVDNKEKEAKEKEISAREEEIEKIDTQIEDIKVELSAGSNDFASAGKQLTTIKDSITKKQALVNEYTAETTGIKVELGRIDTRKQDVREDIIRELGDEGILAGAKGHPELDEHAAREEIEKLKTKLYAIGEIDPEVEEEFKEVEERVTYLDSQIGDLEKAKGDLEKLIKDLDGKIKKQFEGSFSAISKKFTHFFEVLFDGGEAGLELVRSKVDSEGAEAAEGEETFGIEITAVPPGKKVKSLSALSGGERTLTSLALLFAILSVNPAPFVLLDEVDAALDESNTKRFLKIVNELSKSTQFIFITHNRETMKEANLLYGVTMDDSHASKLISIKLEDALEKVKK